MKINAAKFLPLVPLTLLSALAIAQSEPYWLGYSPGPFATGTQLYQWIDDSRQELTTSIPDDKRQITAQVWYPGGGDEGADPAAYAANIDQYASYVGTWGQDFAERPTRSLLGTGMAESESLYPVIVYMAGGGAPVFTGTSQTEFLASHGYVVLGIEHTDTSGRASYPDGTAYSSDVPPVVPPEEEGENRSNVQNYHTQSANQQSTFRTWVQDLIFALNQLEQLNDNPDSVFYQRLDLDHVGAMGWSLGGANAFQATLDDERIVAAVNMDGTMFGRPVESSGNHRPLLFLESTANRFEPLASRRVDPGQEELSAYIEQSHWGMFRMTTADWFRARIIDASHLHFSDVVMGDEYSDEEMLGFEKSREIINSTLLEFFDKYLRGSEDTPLLSGEQRYPELRLVTKTPDDE